MSFMGSHVRARLPVREQSPLRWTPAIVGGLLCAWLSAVLSFWLVRGDDGIIRTTTFIVGLVAFSWLFLRSGTKAWARMWLTVGIMFVTLPVAIAFGGWFHAMNTLGEAGFHEWMDSMAVSLVALIFLGALGLIAGVASLVFSYVAYARRRKRQQRTPTAWKVIPDPPGAARPGGPETAPAFMRRRHP